MNRRMSGGAISRKPISNSDTESIRVLVLGDSGVGKTSLVHLLTQGAVLKRPIWTVGCQIEISVQEFAKKPMYVEWIDVGGSRDYAASRRIFYNMHPFHGLILVYDLTNKNSYNNLGAWVREAVGEKEFTTRIEGGCRHLELATSPPIPVLIIGNKLDLMSDASSSLSSSGASLWSDPPLRLPVVAPSTSPISSFSSSFSSPSTSGSSMPSASSSSNSSNTTELAPDLIKFSSHDPVSILPGSRVFNEIQRFLQSCYSSRNAISHQIAPAFPSFISPTGTKLHSSLVNLLPPTHLVD